MTQVLRALIVAVVASLALGLALDTAPPPPTTAHHCGSFETQAEAQAHITKQLDRDSDGRACERLP
jgi:hypothetical protein